MIGERIELLAKLSNLPPASKWLKRLINWVKRPGVGDITEVECFARGEMKHHLLTLIGGVGLGKTHLAQAIAWDWLEQGKTVAYYQVEDLLDKLRGGYRMQEMNKESNYERLLNFVLRCSLLVLDDLGVEKETEWSMAKLDQIIDHRYAFGLPTIIMTNLALSKLPERIADRLSEGVVVHLKGKSYRTKGASGNVVG